MKPAAVNCLVQGAPVTVLQHHEDSNIDPLPACLHGSTLRMLRHQMPSQAEP